MKLDLTFDKKTKILTIVFENTSKKSESLLRGAGQYGGGSYMLIKIYDQDGYEFVRHSYGVEPYDWDGKHILFKPGERKTLKKNLGFLIEDGPYRRFNIKKMKIHCVVSSISVEADSKNERYSKDYVFDWK